MPKRITGVADDLRRRIWFKLLPAAEKALAEHNEKAKAINTRNKRRARRFTENKKATPAYKRDGGWCGVWLPKEITEFPGGKCTGTTSDQKSGTLLGRYWEPALNRKSGKLFADELKKWEPLPMEKDFLKQLAPQLSADDFSEDGHYFIRATIGTLAGITVVGVSNCKHNREAAPHPWLVQLKASDVLALYEKQEELEEASAAK